ncbi:MAG: cation transporter [Methanosarcinaceae archaeon]|nr:cation transporter [Methanosarcinaceae archaeon]
MPETKIKIEGMSCGHCQTTVTNAISAIDGVSHVEVGLEEGQAKVMYDPEKTDIEAIKGAVVKVGYKA